MLRDDTERVNQQVSGIHSARVTKIYSKNRFPIILRDGRYTSKSKPSDLKTAKSSQGQGLRVELCTPLHYSYPRDPRK